MDMLHLFIHSSVDEHLDRMQFWTIKNKTAVKRCIKSLCGPKFSFLLGKYQGVGLLTHAKGMFNFRCKHQT